MTEKGDTVTRALEQIARETTRGRSAHEFFDGDALMAYDEYTATVDLSAGALEAAVGTEVSS